MKQQTIVSREILLNLYFTQKLSVADIATELHCSSNKIIYWMNKYNIERRSISEAIYHRHNPNGDPFTVKEVDNLSDAILYGLGMGLYWGEGTKADKNSVRLGSSDPNLLNMFIKFLVNIYGIDKQKLRFGLQIFSDINPGEALKYWQEKLDVEVSQFYKPHITPSGSLGTYRQKSLYGVVTVYFINKKLRDKLISNLQEFR